MLLPILFVLMWSSGAIFIETALLYNHPLQILMIRLVFTALILAAIFIRSRQSLKLTGKQILQSVVTGLLMQGIYQVFFFYSMYAGISAGLLAIILATQPILLALVMSEKLSQQQWLGLMIGLCGLVFVTYNNLFSKTFSLLGVIFSIISLLGITVGTMFQKKYCSAISLLPNLLIQHIASALLLITLCQIMVKTPIQWNLAFVISVAWIVLVVSIGATFILYYLLKIKPASTVTSYLYAVPVMVSLLDFIAFHHTLPIYAVVGMVVIIFGQMLIHGNFSFSLNRLIEKT